MNPNQLIVCLQFREININLRTFVKNYTAIASQINIIIDISTAEN